VCHGVLFETNVAFGSPHTAWPINQSSTFLWQWTTSSGDESSVPYYHPQSPDIHINQSSTLL